MIKINSENDNIKVNVASAGNKSNVNLSYPQFYYDGLSKQWAISENIINNEDYSSKHYAEESKKQANLATEQATIATNKVNEVIENGNEALSKISAQETTSKNAVKSEGESQVASVLSEGKEQVSKIQAEGNSQFKNIQTEGQAQVESVKNQGAVSASSVNSAGELQVKAVKSEGINQVNLAKTEVVKATEQANLAKQYASSIDKESINNSKMYTTGSVSVDPQGYNQLLKMKQNTTVTGIDVAKADDYDVVGNPVITDDGIASGFSSGNYLKTSIINRSKPFSQTFKILTPNDLSITEEGIFVEDTNTIYLSRIQLNANGYLALLLTSNGTSWDICESASTIALSVNTEYFIKLSWDGTTYKVDVSIDNKNFVTYIMVQSTLQLRSVPILIGKQGVYPFTGSIDLNSFKIYVNGNLVYQPCLKIPYTQSKTGSKIVDVAYRDRVQDLYEQTGTAPYYTIDETNQNFTLPMGEIYGMIESVRSSKLDIPSRYIVEISDKSLMPSWYVVYNDGWCEQGGRLLVNTNQTVTITFIKSFLSTNYTAFKNLGVKSTGSSNAQELSCFNFTNTTMQTQVNTDHKYSCWYAEGYIS